MPPLCSTVRMPRVDRRMRTSCPRLSDSSDVTWRFGRKRRRVLLLAWLTLLPLRTPLPVISQRRDIAHDPQNRLEAAGYDDPEGRRQARRPAESPTRPGRHAGWSPAAWVMPAARLFLICH